MSLQDGTLPIPSDPNAESDIDQQIELPASLFVAHLTTYPAVAAAVGFAASFPVVKVFASNAVPLFLALKDRSKPVSDPVIKRATPVIIRADKLGDDLLTTFDKALPQLKTTQPDQVIEIAYRPIETVRTTATAYSTAAQTTVSERVLKPLKSVSDRVRSRYSAVYDTKGKALIRSQLDPIFLPVNNRLEAIINDYLPEGVEIPKDVVSNEFSRTWRLALTAFRRARPVIDEQASNIATLQTNTRQHVHEVYEAKKSESNNPESVSGTVYASIATWRQLSSEGVSLAGSVLQPKTFDTKVNGLVSAPPSAVISTPEVLASA